MSWDEAEAARPAPGGLAVKLPPTPELPIEFRANANSSAPTAAKRARRVPTGPSPSDRVEGRLERRSFTDKDRKERDVTEVIAAGNGRLCRG